MMEGMLALAGCDSGCLEDTGQSHILEIMFDIIIN